MIISAFLGVLALSEVAANIDINEWTRFKKLHGKLYSTKEERWRQQIFLENKKRIIENNKLYKLKKVSFQMDINRMTDMLKSEIIEFNGYNLVNNEKGPSLRLSYIVKNKTVVPAVDWRDKGAVQYVRDQGVCGSCYAITTAQVLEGQLPKLYNRSFPLSAQRLIDCSESENNHGCNGGLMTKSYNYFMKNGGLEAEENYPYTGEEGKCVTNKSNVVVEVESYVNVLSGDEFALQQAVKDVGPIAVGIDAGRFSFAFYNAGIYYDVECSSVDVNHAVLIVGYGSDNTTDDAYPITVANGTNTGSVNETSGTTNGTAPGNKNGTVAQKNCNGKDYWIIKNSWGTLWGEDGYVRIAKGCNHCGVAVMPSYPIVKMPSPIKPTTRPPDLTTTTITTTSTTTTTTTTSAPKPTTRLNDPTTTPTTHSTNPLTTSITTTTTTTTTTTPTTTSPTTRATSPPTKTQTTTTSKPTTMASDQIQTTIPEPITSPSDYISTFLPERTSRSPDLTPTIFESTSRSDYISTLTPDRTPTVLDEISTTIPESTLKPPSQITTPILEQTSRQPDEISATISDTTSHSPDGIPTNIPEPVSISSYIRSTETTAAPTTIEV